MRAHRERLLDDIPTSAAPLRRPVRLDRTDGYPMQRAIVPDPAQEGSPPGIMDGLGEMPVPDHVAYLQVFVGNQIVRGDKRACLLAGKVFALPLYLEIPFRQGFPGFPAVLASLVLARHLPMQPLESLLGLAVVVRVLDRMSIGVGVVGTQPYIYPGLLACGDMLNHPVGLNAKLDVVAVCPSEQAHPLDLLDREGLDLLPLVSNQPHPPDATAIREGQVPAVGVQFPARLLVLHRAVIVLEAGIALPARFLLLAFAVELLDGKPGTGGGGLSGLGVEPSGKGEVFGEDGAEALQVIAVSAARIHP